MKSIFLIFCVFSLLTLMSSAQSHRVYFSVGHNFPTSKAVLGSFQSNYSFNQFISTYSEGIVYQGGYQFALIENLLFDINFNYLPGYKDEKYYLESDGSYASYSNSCFSFIPSVNIKIEIGKLEPYTKFGFSVNFIKLETRRKSGNIFSNGDLNFKYKGGATLGFVGGAGINFLFDKTIIGFIEAQLNSFTYYPTELEESYIYNGTKITNKYELKENENTNSIDNIIPSQDFPFNSLGIIAGLRFVL
jgi:hypothetical protein